MECNLQRCMSPLMVQGGLANDGNASATKIRVIEADRRPQSYAGRIVFASRLAARFRRSGTGRSILSQSFDVPRLEPAGKASQALVGPSGSE